MSKLIVIAILILALGFIVGVRLANNGMLGMYTTYKVEFVDVKHYDEAVWLAYTPSGKCYSYWKKVKKSGLQKDYLEITTTYYYGGIFNYLHYSTKNTTFYVRK